jgi:hypothetical protein
MKNHAAQYTKGEIGKVKIIKDFVPHPSDLVLKDDNVRVTLSLSRWGIEVFNGKRRSKACRIRKRSGRRWMFCGAGGGVNRNKRCKNQKTVL